MNNSPETIPNINETGSNSAESAAEQLEKISSKHEAAAELSPRDIETQAQAKAEKEAREKALEAATSAETKENKPSKSSSGRKKISKKELNASYKKTIRQVQKELPTSSRAFSKIIHVAPIEKASDFIGSTVARPNAILSGSIVAFILTLATYLTAKKIGYRLSGFETIAAFTAGWIIGLIYDYLKAMFTGKKL